MTAMINAMRVPDQPCRYRARLAICLSPGRAGVKPMIFPTISSLKGCIELKGPAPPLIMLREAAELIRRKEKPLLICGGGVRYSGSR